MKLSVGQKINIGFALALIVLIVVSAVSYRSTLRFNESVAKMARMQRMMEELDDVLLGIREAVIAENDFLITGEERYLEPYYFAAASFKKELQDVGNLIYDDPLQQRRFSILQSLVEAKYDYLQKTIELRKTEKFGATPEWVTTDPGKKISKEIETVVHEMTDREMTASFFRTQSSRQQAHRTTFVILFGNFLAFALVIFATLLIHRDLAARRRAEQKIKELNERLKERSTELEITNKELEAFSYSVSHDLRGPLTVIFGFTQLLLDNYGQKLEGEALNYLHRIQNRALQMEQLMKDLIKLSHISRSELIRKPVDLSASVEKIVEGLKAEHPDRDVDFFIEPGVLAEGDASLIQIALENLIGNAWKFTSKQPKARIEFGRFQNEQGEQIYFIRDNGAGFDMERAQRLFKPFERLHSTQEFRGSGIGLAIVQRIIERHGGRIWAEGWVEKGATFYFTLSHP